MAGFVDKGDCPGDGGITSSIGLGLVFIFTVLILIVALVLSEVFADLVS